jgi:alkanesulfonate monooxygenase SsuD/methylene tetrahydromethanopterin reductase-like flavin-dependent oxidoreductase (luciferase family)
MAQPIKYGMFIMPFHPSEKPLVQCYDEDLELIVRCDELGFHEFWIGEHHSLLREAIPLPEAFIARALPETKNIRMGAAPVCLNQHNPASVATRLGFLDHLSKGRLNLCFGPGSTASDTELFGLDSKVASEMTREAIEMILTMWTSDPPYDIQGKHWHIRMTQQFDEEIGFGYIHKPYQKPYPPIAMPAMSPNSSSMKTAGKYGFHPFAAALSPTNVVANFWDTYQEAALAAGRMPDRADFKICRAIYLADTTQEACERARQNSLGENFEYIAKVLDRGLGRDIYKRDRSMSDSQIDMDYFMKELIIAGDVNEVLRRLLEMIEETGPFGTLVMMGYDWDDKQSWVHCLELFAKELMPALNKALGVSVTE